MFITLHFNLRYLVPIRQVRWHENPRWLYSWLNLEVLLSEKRKDLQNKSSVLKTMQMLLQRFISVQNEAVQDFIHTQWEMYKELLQAVACITG